MNSRLHEILGELVAADTVSSRSNVAAFERLADRIDGAGFRVRLQRWKDAGAEKAKTRLHSRDVEARPYKNADADQSK